MVHAYGYNFSRAKYGPSSRGTVRVELDINPTYGGGNSNLEPGNWTLQVTRDNADQEVNGYLYDQINPGHYWWGGIEYTGLDPARNSKTVVFPATADKAIVVGAYNDATGAIAAYSGRGAHDRRPSRGRILQPRRMERTRPTQLANRAFMPDTTLSAVPALPARMWPGRRR